MSLDRPYENWSNEDLYTEFERLETEAKRWNKNAFDAANSGQEMGMAYFREYEAKAREFWNQAAKVVQEMRVFRDLKEFPQKPDQG